MKPVSSLFTIHAPTSGLPFVSDGTGTRRALGHVPSRTKLRAAYAPAVTGSDLIDPKDYVEFDDGLPAGVGIKDQGSVGSCNPNSETLNLQIIDVLTGRPNVVYSALALYGWLTGGRDVGSSPDDGLEWMQKYGVPPESMMPPGLYDPDRYPANTLTEAARYRCEVGQVFTTDAQLATALQRRWPVTIAVPVGNAFSDLDSEGVAPLAYGFCNHAVTLYGGMKRARNGHWIGKVANSWGTRWGLDGYFWIYLDGVMSRPGADATMFQAAADDPQDPGLPDLN